LSALLERNLAPLAIAVTALLEQAERARENGSWDSTGALLENASWLCQMIYARQKEGAKREKKTA
jgi:hypothetical protein